MITRASIPAHVAELAGNRPTRWLPRAAVPGGFDGHERTVEIFDVPAAEQVSLMQRLRERRHELETAAGGPLVFVFHTPRESERLYARVLVEWEWLRGSHRP